VDTDFKRVEVIFQSHNLYLFSERVRNFFLLRKLYLVSELSKRDTPTIEICLSMYDLTLVAWEQSLYHIKRAAPGSVLSTFYLINWNGAKLDPYSWTSLLSIIVLHNKSVSVSAQLSLLLKEGSPSREGYGSHFVSVKDFVTS